MHGLRVQDCPYICISIAIPIPEQKRVVRVSVLICVFYNRLGIVYCLSRNNADDVCQGLRQAGISAGSYHTDRLPTERSTVHRQWLDNSIQVHVEARPVTFARSGRAVPGAKMHRHNIKSKNISIEV